MSYEEYLFTFSAYIIGSENASMQGNINKAPDS